jgi:bifunctional non-homologous end joining protein LigD
MPARSTEPARKPTPTHTPKFVEPVLLQSTTRLPEGPDWQYELKLDGYRAIAFKTGGRVHLRSRNDNDFSTRFAGIVRALEILPGDTIIDGEVVALDSQGKPSFNLLQNHGSAAVTLVYFAFDLLMLTGVDLKGEPLTKRRELLINKALANLKEPIRLSPVFEANLPDLIRSVKAQGLEGLIAKRRDSVYRPGERSGLWQKMRLNQGQELVIGGYTPGARGFDALVIGYYDQGKLMYAARTRNGFTPTSRDVILRGSENSRSTRARLRTCQRSRPAVGARA